MLLSAAGAYLMQNNFKDKPRAQRGEQEEPQDISTSAEGPGRLSRWMQSLLQMGLGEFMLRAATNIFSVAAIILVVWLAQMYFRQPAAMAQANGGPPGVP